MYWLVVLVAWSAVGFAWWMVAATLVARSRAALANGRPTDDRRLTIFKPVAEDPTEREFDDLSTCLESFVAELDANSELLIGCHTTDRARFDRFIELMRHRYPTADVRLVEHDSPTIYAHPKVSWMRILSRYATGELWMWSDSDIIAPSGTLRSLRADFAAAGSTGLVTSPYVIRRNGTSPELLDALYVNLEFYPGVVLMGRMELIRFAFGSGMFFEAAEFRRRIDWEVLGSQLAEDFFLGRNLGPARLATTRLSTLPASKSWRGAIRHYLRWQKTVRWSRPGSYAAQLIILPLIGWLAWLLGNPTNPIAWVGSAVVLAADAVAAVTICRILGCPIEWRSIHAIPIWSLARVASWIAVWLPWPIVWRERRWWSPAVPAEHAISTIPRSDAVDARTSTTLD